MPFTTLYLAVIALVLGFKTSSNLAAACGIAVTGTMTIDTVLITLLSKNATSATDFFKIPTNRVVELGTQLAI